jgi:two-component system, NtrC family, sensor histidine kinase GlrK
MRISNKIAAGYAILIALIIGVFSYQVSVIHKMQSITQDLGGLNFRSALLSLEILRDLEQIEEFTQKLFATGGDPGYASQLEQMRQGFSDSLAELKGLQTSPEETAEADKLASLWETSVIGWENVKAALQANHLREAQTELDQQLALLSEMQVESQGLIRSSRSAISTQVQISEQAAQRAFTISVYTGLLALLLSIAVSIWVVRSISGPLHRLTEGTRAVSQGEFSYRLDANGADELSDLARDFNLMTQRLTELDQMKKDFVSHASHELKTPLASMQETIRLLLDGLPGPLTQQQRQLLELNLKSGERLSRLIANLLDLSRMEAGVMEYDMERQDLAGLIRSCLPEYEFSITERQLELQQDLPADAFWVHCDAIRIRQVLDNLMGNAQKFSPAGSAIQIALRREFSLPRAIPAGSALRVTAEPNPAGFALISVADQGPGVPAEEKARIFEKFHQVRRNGRHSGPGTGLGLAISRTIAEAHHGAIWVEDNPGGGSVFCLLLPAETTAARMTRASAPI